MDKAANTHFDPGHLPCPSSFSSDTQILITSATALKGQARTRRWTLADKIDDNQFEAFPTEVAAVLRSFVASDGAAAVPDPAYIAVAAK